MGLLSGLSGLGLGGLDGLSLYDTPQKETLPEQAEEEKKPAAPVIKESDFLFEKSYKCSVCDKDFKVLAVRAGKAKLKGTDEDLRPSYDNIEPLKYDVVMCPKCGCAALTRYWGNLTDSQRKNIRANIGKVFKPKQYGTEFYTYEEAFERYQMALANSMIKQAKASEKAYICLKTGWLLKAQIESLDSTDPEYEAKKKEIGAKSNEYLKNALEGFVNARRTESFPICGMDETTVDYLLSALFIQFGEYDQAARLVGNILISKTASSRMKDKASILKEKIMKEKA